MKLPQRYPNYNWLSSGYKWSLVIGRFQPFHDGHKALIQKLLDEGKAVLVAIRDTPNDADNPYSISERRDMIWKAFPEIYSGWDDTYPRPLEIIDIPDIEEVCYGRKVGWGIREIHLDEDTESISASQIRETSGDSLANGAAVQRQDNSGQDSSGQTQG